MISPEIIPNWQGLAYFRLRLQKTLGLTTKASIVDGAGVGEYPRTAPVYTIRTPSPGGQLGASTPKLLVFFCKNSAVLQPARRQNELSSGLAVKFTTRGFHSCRSTNLRSWLRPALGSFHAVIRLVNKRSAAQPLAPVQRSSQTETSFRGQPLALGQTCSTASSTQTSVINANSLRLISVFNHAKHLCVAFGVSCAPSNSYPSCQRKTSHV